MSDTIYALATAPGKAGVAVVRISGPNVVGVLARFGVRDVPARSAVLRTLRWDQDILDQALILRFEAGASFTGEEVAELQLHGSVAVVRAVLDRLEETGLARMAESGEFTRRALLNDRLDLTEVQGLADVIEAETELQRREAMRVFSGEMSERLSRWRDTVVRALALFEATIDFADEEVPEDVRPEVRVLLSALVQELQRELDGVTAARSLRSGFEVALIGAPNAGKSSLINYITSSDVAIVSPIAGTTRDVLERAVDLDGLRVVFLDTAGIRDTDDAVEGIGVDRAVKRADGADLRLFLHEEPVAPTFGIDMRDGDLTLRTKSDVNGGHGISSVTGDGVAKVLAHVRVALGERVGKAGFVSRHRDEVALRSALDVLSHLLAVDFAAPDELIAEDLRRVAHSLRGMIGGVDMEVVLDEIFSSFCLGK